jgi:hypothetical protein
MKRRKSIERLDDIWYEYLVASSATDLLETRLRSDPSFGADDGWRSRDALRWRAKLETTFLIRIQAEFEACLRDVWVGHFHQESQPRMRELVIAISARRNVPARWREHVDEVRVFRNALLHEGSDGVLAVSMAEARAHLIRFLSRLPQDW